MNLLVVGRFAHAVTNIKTTIDPRNSMGIVQRTGLNAELICSRSPPKLRLLTGLAKTIYH